MVNSNVPDVVVQVGKINFYYFLLFLNMFISVYFFIENNLVSSELYLFSIFIFGLALFNNLYNIIFFLRTFFLGIVGYLAYTIKLIDENIFFAFHMQETQTIEITSIIFLFTNIAIFTSEFGLRLGLKIKVKKMHSYIYEDWRVFYIIFFLLLIVASILSIKQPLIFFSQYASETIRLPIQNFNTIGAILLFILVMYFFKYKNLLNKNTFIYKTSLIFISIYLLIFSELLRGARMDFLNGLIGLTLLYNLYVYNNTRMNFKLMLYGGIFFIILQVIGLIRSVIAIFGFDGALSAITKYLENIGEGNSGGVLIVQGTINNIAATFSGTIYMIKNDMVEYYYGSSYLDYILRTPPQFIYPDRPQSLSWIFTEHNMTSGGGFFELAEAYLNFGIFGIFIIPFLVSFVISYSFKVFSMNRYSLKHSIVFFAIVAVFMRGELYQTFVFYKGIITGIILYYLIYILYGFFNLKIFRIGGKS